MDLVATCLLYVLMFLGFVLLSVKSALALSTSVRGNTNVPGPPGSPKVPILGHPWEFATCSNMKGFSFGKATHLGSELSAMDLVVTCLLCVLIVLGFVLLSVKSALAPKTPVRGKTNVPGPRGSLKLPILGHGWKFVGVSNMKGRDRKIRFQGPLYKKYIFSRISKSNKKDPDMYGPVNVFADGMFSRNGEGWSDLRKPLNKLLQPKTVVENHFHVIAERNEELCNMLDKICNNGISNIHPYMQNLALEITFETLMGVPAAHVKYFGFGLHWAREVTKLWFKLVTQAQYKLRWIFCLSNLKKEFELLQDKLLEVGQRLVSYRTGVLKENGQDLKDPDFEPECYTDVTMKQALKENQDGHSLPIDVVVAGYDTSSVSLSSACLFLAMHPEYQERAYQEQVAIMGETLRAPTYEETTKMDYLGMVYLETLRHIGVPAIVRQLSAEVVVDDFVFPEGAAVYVTLHGANIRSDYWEKPKEFYPDHFLPENVLKRPKGAFLPFSAGARICPGKTFAIISSKIILSMILRRFCMATPLKFDEMEYNYLIMLESVKGYPIQLNRRTSNKNEFGRSS